MSSHQAEHSFAALLQQAFAEGYEQDLLQLLMTPDERDAFATRVRIVQALMSDEISQRELKNELGVGIATITRGSNSLKMARPDFRAWLQKQLLPVKAKA